LPPRRVENFCALLGALTGLFTFGLVPLAIFLFPMVMAVAMRTVVRWEWMPPGRESTKSGRGLGLLFLAPLSFLLLAYPFAYLLLIPLGAILASFVLLFHPGPHVQTGHGVEDGAIYAAAILSSLAVLLIYSWFLGRALKRFAGAWHRGLFWQLIAWIGGLATGGILVLSKLNSLGNAQIFSLTDYWLILLWALSVLTLSRAAAIFGQWLTRSA
jgi:hypothetical protein